MLPSRINLAGFNPRSREGSDHRSGYVRPERACFNPRSREGSDNVDEELSYNPDVSIHAPVKGATYYGYYYLQWNLIFNPRSREGSVSSAIFKIVLMVCFNPRSREGSDWLQYLPQSPISVSIHAPVKGATYPVEFALI